MLQDELFEVTVVHLCRMTDHRKVAGHLTMSLDALLERSSPTIRPTLAALVETAKTAAKAARDRRNRHIAHRDLRLYLEQGVDPLADVSRAQIEAAIQAVYAVLNTFLQLTDNGGFLDEAPGRHVGASRLVYVMRDGLRWRQQQRVRLGDGPALTAADIEPDDE
jgi:hypothetical protein